MKIVPLALATALAAVVGSAQPTLAQPYEQSGGGAGNQSQSDMNAPDQQNHSWDRDQDWHSRSNRRHHSREEGSMGPGGMHPGWMGAQAWGRGGERNGGAHFRFTRGNARIDIMCPANENVEQCVKATGELIDKVMSMKDNAETAGPKPSGAPGANPPPAPGNTMPDNRP